MVVVIMAGGIGTRFWPLSTDKTPKQFLHLFGDRTLFQMSYDRVCDFVPPERILVLTNAAFVAVAQEQLPDVPPQNIIGEPMRKDTAAAVGLAAVLCRKRFGNPIMAILTADHMIKPVSLFQKTLLSAVTLASQSPLLYTFGIEPTYPATAYGYLERGPQTVLDDGIAHFELLRFKEKPDLKTAQEYVRSGKFYWNSGMFVWQTDAILKEIENHLPAHFHGLTQLADHDGTSTWQPSLASVFSSLPRLSIDFGVMEKADNVHCVGSTFSWSDVGGWLGLKPYLPEDSKGNHARADVKALDASGNVIFCEDPTETVLLIGVEDLVIVRAHGGMVVAHKDRAEDIKKLVERMHQEGES